MIWSDISRIPTFHPSDVPSSTKRKLNLWSGYSIQPALNSIVYSYNVNNSQAAKTISTVSDDDVDQLCYTTIPHNWPMKTPLMQSCTQNNMGLLHLIQYLHQNYHLELQSARDRYQDLDQQSLSKVLQCSKVATGYKRIDSATWIAFYSVSPLSTMMMSKLILDIIAFH